MRSAYLSCDEGEEVDHHFGQADKIFAAQDAILRRYTGRAIVQVTNTQILAAQSYHRAGSETETFCAEHCRLDHIEAGFQAAVRLQANLVPHIMLAKYLMRFGQAQAPRDCRRISRSLTDWRRYRRHSPKS